MDEIKIPTPDELRATRGRSTEDIARDVVERLVLEIKVNWRGREVFVGATAWETDPEVLAAVKRWFADTPWTVCSSDDGTIYYITDRQP